MNTYIVSTSKDCANIFATEIGLKPWHYVPVTPSDKKRLQGVSNAKIYWDKALLDQNLWQLVQSRYNCDIHKFRV